MKSTYILIYLSFITQAYAFDHSHKAWDQILKNFTKVESKQTLVDYQKIKKDFKKLDSYLNDLTAVNQTSFKKWTKDDQLAFLINAYNAFTIKLIINHFPIKSIKDIGSFFSSPWKKEFFSLFGEKSYLDKIEHETIRKQFNEPRIHFAVNCASISCPSLFPEAFTGNKLNSQLDKVTKHFLNNRTKNMYDKTKQILHLSKIFKWYAGDFEKKFKSIENFVKKYLTDITIKDIEYMDYDWNLNTV